MEEDYWQELRNFTHARIAMGRAGNAMPTSEILSLRMAHALARDAVQAEIKADWLNEKLFQLGLNVQRVKSQAQDRVDYIRNPNKGRLLHGQSRQQLESLRTDKTDLCIIFADGLSADAVNIHAIPFIELLLKELAYWNIAPIILAEQGRVGLSDPIGEALNAQISLILLGERPGLSAPTSLGAYITYMPRSGNTDEKRNCVSNIQPAGLSYQQAVYKISYLLHEIRSQQLSGVQLKDNQRNDLL
ncbi:MAG: ethanolamine ammonia-lyase subunit EutC [Cytophaga sp.]|uniref:ethanolamine ammonia-lyase subunit EutC n=1 Tax=Cytophaga sp. TaxID=29535 RepID=UPI003F7E584C